MSQNRDMGHPISWFISDLGQPPGSRTVPKVTVQLPFRGDVSYPTRCVAARTFDRGGTEARRRPARLAGKDQRTMERRTVGTTEREKSRSGDDPVMPSSDPTTAPQPDDDMRSRKWSAKEKAVARCAFDRAEPIPGGRSPLHALQLIGSELAFR